MKIPNAESAFVDIVKLRDYSLNPEHKEGKHKARVFGAALGLTVDHAEWLREKLLEAAKTRDCWFGRKTEFGQRYLIDFEVTCEEKSARLRSVWIVRRDENLPRLVTYDVVALLVDKPEGGLVVGQVGTVVEVLAPDFYEVEFL
jgi:Domain of unknown function (DUF4926)